MGSTPGPVPVLLHIGIHSAVFDRTDFAADWVCFEDMARLLAGILQVQGPLEGVVAGLQAAFAEGLQQYLDTVDTGRSWTLSKSLKAHPTRDRAASERFEVTGIAVGYAGIL